MKSQVSFPSIVLAASLLLQAAAPAAAAEGGLRPPAVPLVTHDPYFSVWSPHDRLTDGPTVHWTGKRHSLSSMVRIDGKAFRLMGGDPADVPALPQKTLMVLPTRTFYIFGDDRVEVALGFITPALPDDLDLLSRPVTYVWWGVRSTDGESHAVEVYFDAAAELAVNVPDQQVLWERRDLGDLALLRAGSKDQPVLAKKGDDLRIDWGHLFVGAARSEIAGRTAAPAAEARGAFAAGRPLPSADDGRMPRPAKDGDPVLALALDLGKVGEKGAERTVLIAYDDIFSIQYMGRKLRPYWARKGAAIDDVLGAAWRDREAVGKRCTAFDAEFLKDLEAAGGRKYARLAALAYRQTLAGNKLAADDAGMPLFFPKECFSNGCIATVDVIYPMAPLFLLFGPAMAKATLVPVLNYAESPRWKFPFAPHDLGTYPLANGQVYGEGEDGEKNQMPVEESGNLLILIAALAKAEGSASFAERYWPVLTKWAGYLKEKGLDPANQLCTDDFAGHLAHNVNLSAKAIVGLGSYAMLCDMLGKKEEAASYRKTAEEFARAWADKADDGDHYRLAFDRPGTWSQKYNLVWDRVLGLAIFPESVAKKEMAYYRKIQNRYGIPLDNRKDYTKLDWVIWTATLTGDRQDFEAIADRAYAFLDESPSRVPMSDWYETKDAKMTGFRARPVVGGVFMPAIANGALWKKWADRGARVEGAWAPMPKPPEYNYLVPTSEKAAATWRYSLDRPADGWAAPAFDDGSWKSGPGGFGRRGTPGARVRTEWTSKEIWLRRDFVLDAVPAGDLQVLLHHDEDAEVYLNGALAAAQGGYTTSYEAVAMSREAREALRPGKNVLAVRCRQTDGGQYIDAGIVAVK
jgi:hypothetical protein